MFALSIMVTLRNEALAIEVVLSLYKSSWVKDIFNLGKLRDENGGVC